MRHYDGRCHRDDVTMRTAMQLLAIGASCVILLGGCGDRPIVISERSVILTPRQMPKLTIRGVTGFWTPSAADVQELEKRLPDFIANHTSLHRLVSGDFKQYGGIIRAGRRLMYVNAFNIPPGSQPPDWKRRAVIFGGGGDNVWRIEFDAENKEFTRFEVNGPI
jgi:hypothetical protein